MIKDHLHRYRSTYFKVMGVGALLVALWFGVELYQRYVQGGGRSGDQFNASNNEEEGRGGKLDADVKSEYSRIKITTSNNLRTMWFVRDNGDEVIESTLDLRRPHVMQIEYTKHMFLSYLFRPQPDRVLIVGLGGGSMVHFLNRYDPKVKVDVVEIDPKIVSLADKYFGVKTGGNVNIITQDAFKYFKEAKTKYDVVYMDAFLKPSVATDDTGVQLRLKTKQFYKEIQDRLNPDGLIVYNINPHREDQADIRNIADAFKEQQGQTYVYRLPEDGGYVVVGSLGKNRTDQAALLAEARELDRRFTQTGFTFLSMARRLEK